MDKVRLYRDKAAECWAQAESAPAEAKAALISIAEQYTRLAEFALKERGVRTASVSTPEGKPDEEGPRR